MFTILRQPDVGLRFETHVPLSSLTAREARDALDALELLREDLRQQAHSDGPPRPTTTPERDMSVSRVKRIFERIPANPRRAETS